MTRVMTNDEIPNDEWNDEVRITNQTATETGRGSLPLITNLRSSLDISSFVIGEGGLQNRHH